MDERRTTVTTGPVARVLDAVLDRVRAGEHPGRLATYIPELATVDPERCALSLASVFGRSYAAGDAEHEFTIQSISKPFVFALAVDDLGIGRVRRHVGVEPSGDAFNAITFDDAGRPMNPMINVGALTTTSLIGAESADQRFERIRLGLSAFAGRSLQLDEAVYLSEARTGDRNIALAGLARASGALVGTVADAADPYFRQCSLRVTTTDIAVMGATLAGGGVNPLTGERVISARAARETLSVMASCGMYDRSGDWIVEVGLPAKSGVGGGIVAVSPGRFGIGVFSPPLDEVGNSARGVAMLEALSREFDLHLFNRGVSPVSPIEEVVRDDVSHRILVRLRGELDVVAAERVSDRLQRVLPWYEAGTIELDLEAVTGIDKIARTLIAAVLDEGARGGYEVVLTDPADLLSPPA